MTTVVHVKGSPAGPISRGVLFIHSCPRALSPHVEWSLARVVGSSMSMNWSDQPIEPGSVRAEAIWHGPAGTAARFTSALLAFTGARFEVTEDPSAGREGERFSVTGNLGLFRATIGVHGDVMVSEERLKSALQHGRSAGPSVLAAEISKLIGTPWDEELEPFRCGQADSTVRVLPKVV